MFENNTYDVILNRMLDRVKSSGVDISEGSLIYNAIAPEAWELSEAYIAIDTVYNNTFADTAPREELILRAKERGLEPKPATNAILKGIFNIDIPMGSRFSLDDLNYIVMEKIDYGIYKLQCESAGIVGNKKFGNLIPIEYIDGLTSAELTELLIPGADEEETETFRARYFNSFNSVAFGGNKADYIEKLKSINGVGGAKVFRVTVDNYNVLVQIINSEFGVPSTDLIHLVQNTIDPTQDENGVGLAPIGHVVNVQGVAGVTVNISTSITYEPDYIWDDVSENIKAAVDSYFLSLSQTWEKTDNLTIRISQLESKILEIPGVLDITNTLINGSTANLSLESSQIPLRGEISASN